MGNFWQRISLRKAVVIAALLMLVVGWMGDLWHQRSLAVKFKAFGAEVAFSRGKIIGINFDRDNVAFGDEQMPLLRQLKYIEWLHLDNSQVTNAGLQVLHELPQLRTLSVRVDQIDRESELSLGKQIAITKLHTIDGRRVVDGFE